VDQRLGKPEHSHAAVAAPAADGSLVRLALRNPAGADPTLRSLDVRPVRIRGEVKLGFTFHHKTRDLQKNHGRAEAVEALRAALASDFREATLFTTGFDLRYDAQGKSPRLKQGPPTSKAVPGLAHDRTKPRLVERGKPFLAALGITDAQGRVLPSAGDKYRQINRYVEILAPLLAAIPRDRLKRIVDMGSGKGYLTFAVADYLANTLHAEAEVVGVELRPELVALCNDVAADSGFGGKLGFAAGSIASYDSAGAEVLIALHACDTATDDAIARGIAAGSELIVVAPCCHKQIRREMEASRRHADLDFVLRHGIFVERQAEMVTDAMRAMILEHFGYATKVFEFVSDAHTPKNVLIVATKTKRGRDPARLSELAAAKAFFGVRRHYLEDATGL
jgi:SAM-dependent methyltransferase